MNNILRKFKFLLPAVAALAFAPAAEAAFPSISSLTGNYKFSSNFTSTGISYYGGDLSGEFDFQISKNSYESFLTISNFLLESSYTFPAEYDESTGQLTLTKIYFGNSITGNYAISAGDWNGFKEFSFVCQVNEDGSILFPDFSFIKFSGDTVLETYAEYTAGVAVPSSQQTPGGDKPGQGGDQPGQSETSLDGLWTLTIFDPYLAENQTEPQSGAYKVTSKGNVLTFTAQTEHDNGEFFIGVLSEDETTVTFSKAMLVNAYYPKYQFPFTNGFDGVSIDDLNEESFTANFNKAEGILELPEGAGFRFGNVDKNTLELENNWQSAFNWISAYRDGDFPPEITISLNNFVIGEDNVTAVYNFSTTRFDDSNTYVWRPNVLEIVAVEDEDDIELPVDGCSLEVNEKTGIATIVIPNLSKGNHIFNITISAYTTNGNEETLYSTSNKRALSIVVGTSLNIRLSSIEANESSITVIADCFAGSVPADAYYKMRFTPASEFNKKDDAGNDIEPDIEGTSTYVDASMDNGVVTATLGNLVNDEKYDFVVALVVYNANGEQLAVSNNLSVTATTAIELIEADDNLPVRYFDLNGREITNPQRGIYIRVQGNKAQKVITN